MNTNVAESVSFMKQTFRCLSYDNDSFVMNWSMEPKGFVPPHFHAFMDEHFLVEQGEGEFVVDGKKSVARAGDTFVVPRGVPHSIRTHSATPLVCNVRYEPCSDTHRMFAVFGGLKRDGQEGIMAVLKASYICRRAGLESFSTPAGIGGALETVLFGILAPIARIRGWDRLAERYLAE